MSNPKSKLPMSPYSNDDANLPGASQGSQHGAIRSLSSYSRKRSVSYNNQNTVLQELTENRGPKPVPVGLRDRKVAHVTRKKSLKLTYDPGREPGQEYLIVKEGDVQEVDTNESVAHERVSDIPDGLQYFPETSNISEHHVGAFISPEVVEGLDSSKVDKGNDSEKENVDLELDRNESPLSVSEHKSVSLDSFQDTELTDTPKPSTPAKTFNVTLHLPESPKPSASTGRENLPTALDSAKESHVSSVPPPNFKSSLFKRIRKVSTPIKTPRFSPRPSHTPVIDILSLKSETSKVFADDGTFIKDSLSRFQRQDSTESIRIHYDKHIKHETHEDDRESVTRYEHKAADSNANTSFRIQNLPKKDSISYDSRQIVRYDIRKKDSPLLTPVTGKMQLDVKQYENHLTDLAKKPIQHKFPLRSSLDHTSKNTNPISSSNVALSINDSDDAFSDSDNRTKLKQALYITEDLKLVKRKVKETEITMRQNLLKQEASAKKRSVLKNLNTHRKTLLPTLPKRSKVPTRLPQPAKRSPFNLLKIKRDEPHVSVSRHENDARTDITDTTAYAMQSVSTRIIPQNSRAALGSVGTGTSVQTRPRHSIETLHPPRQNMMAIKPKIHRTNPLKRNTKRIGRNNKSDRTFWVTPSITTTSTASVEKWVAQTVKENTINRDTLALPKLENGIRNMPLRKVKKKPKLKIRLQRKKSIAVTNNTINMGMYLPLPSKPRRRAHNVYTQVGKVKGYESEIPILYDDEDGDGYEEQRPLTSNDRWRYGNDFRRYEGEHDHVRINYRDPAHKKVGRTNGALVLMFRNGKQEEKGLPVTINEKIKNFETLLIELNQKLPITNGVKYIFKWPEGREIKSVKDFQNRCVYIVSSTKKLQKDVNYGSSREGFWKNGKPTVGLQPEEKHLFKKTNGQRESPKASPHILTIIPNLQREKADKIILNPQTPQSFEEWLDDLNNQNMPTRALYIAKPPYTQVRSFSHLFREIRNKTTTFIVCGDEYLPVELAKKRQAPSSNSSAEDSMADNRGRKKISRQQDMDQIYENGRPESPTSTSMSRYDTGPRYMVPPHVGQHRQILGESRRKSRGCVEIEIDGVKREFWPPSYYDMEDDGIRPNQMLKCQWVYGFRGRDARHNLAVIPGTGELVYFVASVVVLYDKFKDSQRHYIKHSEEITCLTLHPNGYLVATGQMHGKSAEHSSHIRIWDHETLSTYSVIGVGVFYGGIISIGFNHEGGGTLMCALDGSSKHVLSVWRVSLDRGRGDSNYIIARTSTSTESVHCACFYPGDENSSILITYGARHIYFWKVFYDAARKREAKILRDRNSGIFEDNIPRSINCIAFLDNGDIVTGDSSGNLMVWDRDPSDAFTCRYVVNAHGGPIMSIVALVDGLVLSGGGNEIKAWDSNSNFRCVNNRTIPGEVGGVRSIVTHTPGGFDGNLYVGTTRSCILDGSMQNKFSIIIKGHSDGIFGLVPHPFEPTFITAGTDAVVYKWSLVTHRVYWRSQIDAPCTSLAVDHHNELVALGTSEGTFVILNAFNGMHITTVQVGTETISCLAFSPNGLYLAIGCNDGLISIFNVHDRGHTYVKASMTLRGHVCGVCKLDWSRDNNSLQTVSHDNELMFWDLINMKQNKVPLKTRDIEWFTNTCNISYALLGPWTNLEKGEQVKVVNRSRNRDLVLVGDTTGRLRLYKYPCSRERPDFRNVRVYSSEVTACAFTPDGRGALTCGGKDAALIQWTVEEEFL